MTSEADPLTKNACPHCGCKTLRPDGSCIACGGRKDNPPNPKVPRQPK